MGFIYPRAVPKIGLRTIYGKFHFGIPVHIDRSHGLELSCDEAVIPSCSFAINWTDLHASSTIDTEL